MKRKIMFFLATLNGGGAERVATTIMRELSPNLFDIYLVLVSKEGDFLEFIPNYVKIIELKSKRTLFSIFLLRDIIKNIRPLIVYSTLFRTHIALEFAMIGFGSKPKRVYRSPTSPKILLERKEIGSFMRYLIGLSYLRADVILAQTPQMREEIAKYHNINIEKIKVLPNPIDTKLIDEKIKNSKNPFDSSFINVVSAGRLSKVKGFDTLLYAFKSVLEKNENFFLHIIGRDGGEREFLENLARELDIDNRVKFWGFQKNPYIFYHYADIYVLSSIREGLPNTVLENIYLKKPIIATRCISIMEELIENGVNGFLVDVGDKKALARGILDYKNLNPKKKRIDNNLVDLNRLFIDLINKKGKFNE